MPDKEKVGFPMVTYVAIGAAITFTALAWGSFLHELAKTGDVRKL